MPSTARLLSIELADAEPSGTRTPPQSGRAPSVVTYFQQPCPTCGRRLLIEVERLGQEVWCSHCRRALIARDPCQDHDEMAGTGNSVLERVARLLDWFESPGGSGRICGA